MKHVFTSVRAKLLACLLVGAVVTLGVGSFAVVRMGDLRNATEKIRTEALAPTTNAMGLDSSYLAVLMIGNQEALSPGSAATLEPIRQESLRKIGDYLKTLHGEKLTPKAAQLLDQVTKSYAVAGRWLSPQGLVLGGRPENLQRATGEVRAVVDQIEALVAAVREGNAAIEKSANDTYHSALLFTWIAIGAGLALALGLGIFVSGRLVAPLRRTVTALDRVAGGDLTQRVEVESSDEVGQMAAALNTTISTVHDVVQELEQDAERLAAFARDVSRNSKTPDVKEHAEQLAQMAGDLDAMISIFTIESRTTA